jgi:hypothetical protein
MYDSDDKKIKALLQRTIGFGDMFKTWTLGPIIRRRDASILSQANEKTIKDMLNSKPEFKSKWRLTTRFVPAFGWVEHLSYEVVDTNGNFSDIAQWIEDNYHAQLQCCPILDDELYSKMEYEATLDNIKNAVQCYRSKDHAVIDHLPKNYTEILYGWFVGHYPQAVENYDGLGGYPNNDELTRALYANAWLVKS